MVYEAKKKDDTNYQALGEAADRAGDAEGHGQ